MIWYLQRFFRPDEVEAPEFNLAISLGAEGARLSHNHARQYAYVLQSLSLWREIHNDMFKARRRARRTRARRSIAMFELPVRVPCSGRMFAFARSCGTWRRRTCYGRATFTG